MNMGQHENKFIYSLEQGLGRLEEEGDKYLKNLKVTLQIL